MDYVFISDIKTGKDRKSEADKAWDKLRKHIDKAERLKKLGVIR